MSLVEIGTRFLRYLSTRNRSINAAAIELEMQPSQLYNIVKGRNYGFGFLLQILKKYTDINPVWLIYGKGNMTLSGANKLENQAIPVYDVTATAGKDVTFMEKSDTVLDYISIGEDFMDCNAAVRIYGDSMYPVYQSGDMIILRKLSKTSEIQWGHVYLIATQEDKFLKYVRKSDKKDKCTLVSHNVNYQDFDINLSEITKIFEVTGHIRRVKI